MKQLDFTSRLPSVIHSKRMLNSPQFRAAFDITKIRLKSRSEVRCKTESTAQAKTEHGTCTTEDDLLSLYGYMDIWSVLNRKDLYFIQSPLEVKLVQHCENEIHLTFLDLHNFECERIDGQINAQGSVSYINQQSYKNLFQHTRLLYISLKQNQKCIYICLVQGCSSNIEVQEIFKKFLSQLWKQETKKLCFACYFEFIHLLVWDYSKQQTWILTGQDLDLQHAQICINFVGHAISYLQKGKRGRKITNNENINRQHSQQYPLSQIQQILPKQQSFHKQKLVFEDNINMVMDFIKPNIAQERDRINDIVVLKKTLLRPKSSVERKKKKTQGIITKMFSPKANQNKNIKLMIC